MNPTQISSQKLWAQLSLVQRTLAARHFWNPASRVSPALKESTITAIAKHRNFREVSVRKASREKLQGWLADMLVRLYLLEEHRTMVEAFLDDLRIPHIA